VFRILQESLTNISRHADARNVRDLAPERRHARQAGRQGRRPRIRRRRGPAEKHVSALLGIPRAGDHAPRNARHHQRAGPGNPGLPVDTRSGDNEADQDTRGGRSRRGSSADCGTSCRHVAGRVIAGEADRRQERDREAAHHAGRGALDGRSMPDTDASTVTREGRSTRRWRCSSTACTRPAWCAASRSRSCRRPPRPRSPRPATCEDVPQSAP